MSLSAAALSVDFDTERRFMVDGQLRPFEVTDLTLLRRFLEVPRHLFVGEKGRSWAYSDSSIALPDSPHRVLLQPMLLARLMQSGNILPSDRILDLAGGYGYSAAILSGLADHVVAVETGAERLHIAGQALASQNIGNVTLVDTAVATGAAGHGPFDVILLNGAYETDIEALLPQLKKGGRLLAFHRHIDGRCQAVRIDNITRVAAPRILFQAPAPTIEGFAQPLGFVF